MTLLKPIHYPKRKPSRRVLLTMYKALRQEFGYRNWWPGDTPFEVMVGAILTQNTAWTNVEKAIVNLKKEKVLTPEKLYKIPTKRLAKLIRPAGYFNVKTKRLKAFLGFFHKEYGGRIKTMSKEKLNRLRRSLLEVKGIGKETADSILLYALGKPIFVIDAYTKRVLSRHRYLKENEDYDSIQKVFMELLPRSSFLYNDYHAQIVEVGKRYCKKVPHCERCPLKKYL
ncbi:MAG: endonuclease III domain-containing protein [Candidatus Omnitrophica bacterium]|nr:endonuclease III domain-containing protein [Candidatus Omnitrophota bacterium]